MSRRLKLVKKGVTNINYLWVGAFRLRVECSDPSDSGADPYVFLHRRDPINAYTGTADDVFFAVASPVDLAEYPVGEPNGQTAYPIFRLDYFEIDLRAASLVDEVWTTVVNEVTALLAALEKLESLVEEAAVWVGSEPEEGGSDSDSTSESSSA